MKSIRDIDLKNKRVLVRVDFNVPMDDERNITDDIRMQMALPTLEHIRSQGGKAVICSHFGRPEGKRAESFSMAPVAAHLRAAAPTTTTSTTTSRSESGHVRLGWRAAAFAE